MSGYAYQEQRPNIFSESGVEMLTKIRDNVRAALKVAGAVRANEAWKGVSGSSWDMLACLDYMVEKDEIREVTSGTWGQHRIFTEPWGD